MDHFIIFSVINRFSFIYDNKVEQNNYPSVFQSNTNVLFLEIIRL